jgi:hypothetical protein
VSGDVVTLWGLVFHWERASTGDVRSVITTDGIFARARGAYLDRCAVLGAFLGEEAAEVRVVADPPGDAAAPDILAVIEADAALVGVSVVEVRPSSFDMAVRIRAAGDGEPAPVDLRRTMVVQRAATGERLEIPREVRDEFIAIQLAARDLC